MSSNFTPASFASAAAGQSRGPRDAAGDWSRREGRSTNGTLTFRRPAAPSNQQSSQISSEVHSASGPLSTEMTTPSSQTIPMPPSDQSMLYTRSQLLDIYQTDTARPTDPSSLFVGGWNPTHANGTARGWGKSSEGTVPQDPTVCWDASGGVPLLGITEMSAEDKETFSDINSTLKPPQPKENTQGTGGGVNGRKTSISHGTSGHGSAYNLSSPLSGSRPATRRRETAETNAFPSSGGGLTSPLTGRATREDWFGRKANDQKEAPLTDEPEEEPDLPTTKTSGLGTLGRAGVSAGASGGASMWSTTTTSGPTSAVGAFGNFALPSATSDKRFGSMRGESRLAHLLPKQDAPDTAGKTSGAGGASSKESWRSRPRTDTDPYSDDFAGGGSQQNLSGADQPSHQPPQSFDTPVKSTSSDFGMSGLNIGASLDDDGGVASPDTNPFRSPPAERGDDDHHHTVGLPSGLAGPGGVGVSDHASNFGSLRGYPSNTFDGSDRSQTSSVSAKNFPTLGSLAGWGTTVNTSAPDRDRAVFSNAFGTSLFSPVPGDLQSPGFGSGVPGGVFGPPSAGGAGGMGSGSLRGTSKLGSLFPPSMQAQMAGQEQEVRHLGDSLPDLRQINPLGAIGREAVGVPGREADVGGPGRPGRGGMFDEFLDPTTSGGGGLFAGSSQPLQPGVLASTASPMLPSQFDGSVGTRQSTETPPNAQRTMVMPDRMRWVYLDPQSQTQGPFTGLEMNDWYKANFFTADLRVKKVEDTEFEPLGQLIRRIGNSREPFLVPQMGVPHGQPSLSGTFAHGDRGTVIPPLVGAFPSYGRTLTAEEQNNLERRKQEEQYMLARQREMMTVQQHHPFPGTRPPPTTAGALHHHSSVHSLQSQPSFGSMTAPLGAGGPPPLPGGLGAAGQGFFDHTGMPMSMPPPSSTLAGAGPEQLLRDDLSAQDRQMLSGLQQVGSAPGLGPFTHQQMGLAMDEAAATAAANSGPIGGRPNLPSIDQLPKDTQGFSDRLKEFQQLRESMDTDDALASGLSGSQMPDAFLSSIQKDRQEAAAEVIDEVKGQQEAAENALGENDLSLTQQVQQAQAAAAKRLAVHTDGEEESAVQHVAEPQTEMPTPFPPPQDQSGTHIAAPTAQRSRSTLPDQYAASRSQSETPESAAAAQAPPLAPWARDLASESHHRGPSLKEIQEAEAKKAAKAEEAASAVRRAMVEQEVAFMREREKAAAVVAPGLPTSSTWGSSSPVVAGPSSAWSKPSATSKASGPGVSAGSGSSVVGLGGSGSSGSSGAAGNSTSTAEKKKTLADIQREEEVRKQKTRELAAHSTSSPSGTSSAGKRYADLASKVQQAATAAAGALPASPSSASASSGWATVGAGGKVRAPPGMVASTSRTPTVPGAAAKPAAANAGVVRVASVKHNTGTSSKVDGSVAMAEFNKWLHRELARGITGGIDLDVFVDSLLQLPMDLTIISEAVYASSKTMDGRHFAEEFIRRKKLAEKGVVEKQTTPTAVESKSGSGGWSEVAKKGGSGNHQKEESMPAGFKVVPSRKKGKK